MRSAPQFIDGIAISCGLAGGLRDDLATGTVVIPSRVRRPDGTDVYCDAVLVHELEAIARSMHLDVITDPLLTSATLVHGAQRARWASGGYAAADMETGLLRAERLACVRVVLDTPSREIDEAWLSGLRAAVTPRAWRDLPFLMKNGPACALRAAHVVRAFAQRAA